MSEQILFLNISNIIDNYLSQSYQTLINSKLSNDLFETNIYYGGSYKSKLKSRSKTKAKTKSKIKTKSKSRSKSRNILPQPSKLTKDSLVKHGYKLSKSPKSRHRALLKAARSRGTLSVLKRVNLISILSKSVPKNYIKLRSDVEYLKNKYARKKIADIKKKLS
jgi:hypothetical protein